MLNVRSHRAVNPEDRTVRARVRDAAIDLVAQDGVQALTARAVAQRAGVSAGSVINNFGSMEGLRRACDEHVVALIGHLKAEAMAAGVSFDLTGSLRDSYSQSLAGYLAAILAEGSDAVDNLVDDLVEDAIAYSATGVATGMLQPTDDPRGRAVILTLCSLGTLVMHRHLTRLLGVDLTTNAGGPEGMIGYLRPLYEFYRNGVLTQEFGTRALAALDGVELGTRNPTPQTGPSADRHSTDSTPTVRPGGTDD